MPSAIVQDTLPHHEPIWAWGQWSGATAGGVKDQLLLGPQKQQLQSVWEKCDNQRAFRAQSSTGLVSNGEKEAETGVKGRGSAVLACKLVKTLALTLGGVWEHEEKTSSRVGDEDDGTLKDDAPNIFTEFSKNREFSTISTFTNDKLDSLEWHRSNQTARVMFVSERKHEQWRCPRDERLIHDLTSFLRQTALLVTYVLPPPHHTPFLCL